MTIPTWLLKTVSILGLLTTCSATVFSTESFAAGMHSPAPPPADTDPNAPNPAPQSAAASTMGAMAGAMGKMGGMMGGSPAMQKAMMIVNMGSLAWTIIQANEPTETASTTSANALPASVKSWQELTEWRLPVIQDYEKDYKGFFGETVVSIKYRVHYTYGGTLDGKGLYLTDIAVEPADIHVSYGYKVSVTASVPNIVNMGTADDPIAGAELLLDIKVSTLFSNDEVSMDYFIKGDGTIQDLTAGK